MPEKKRINLTEFKNEYNLSYYSGHYCVEEHHKTVWFGLIKKPCYLHRVMSQLLLGWVWKDNNMGCK